MHDIKAIRDNPQAFDAGLARRDFATLAESLIALDEKRRAAILDLQRAQERRNAASKEIGAAMARKDRNGRRPQGGGRRPQGDHAELEAVERESGAALETALRPEIPNLPFDDVPDGKDETDNVEVRRWGVRPELRGLNKPTTTESCKAAGRNRSASSSRSYFGSPWHLPMRHGYQGLGRWPTFQ